MDRLSTESSSRNLIAPPKRSRLPFVFPFLALLLAAFFFNPAPATIQSEENIFYLPILPISRPMQATVDVVWVEDGTGAIRQAFSPGETISYQISGDNQRTDPISATLSLKRNASCEGPLVYTTTLSLPAGTWNFTTPTFPAGNCHGVYTATVQLESETSSPIKTRHVVNSPTTLVLSENQGFDRCRPPTTEEMQTWWDESPYTIFNLYLGGISYFCDDTPLDALWVHNVAQQGWKFILTWVGPQAPCTGFNHRMSEDPEEAYAEGSAEAADAAAAAINLGLFGERLITIDIEAFPGSDGDCRNAVQAYLQGWVDELHNLGLQAGGYGSPCGSYQSDWANNTPPPDQVWIAHWLRENYDPDVTVWGTPCLSDSLWPDHQRIKQYAGGHVENWGDTALTVDSNVFDGMVIVLTKTAATTETIPITLVKYGREISDFGVVEQNKGWVLSEGSIYLTDDNGSSWAALPTPDLKIIGAAFENERVFVIGRDTKEENILFSQSVDGGNHWETNTIAPMHQFEAAPIRAFVQSRNGSTIEVALQLPSGNSFSRWRIFASSDNGRIWKLKDSDDNAAQNPDGPAFPPEWYIAAVPDNIPNVPAGAVDVRFSNDLNGWAIVKEGTCEGEKSNAQRGISCVQRTKILATSDGGVTWEMIGFE